MMLFALTLLGLDVPALAIWLVAVVAIVAVVVVVLRTCEVSPPPWVVQICWIVAVACVAILAIRLIAGM